MQQRFVPHAEAAAIAQAEGVSTAGEYLALPPARRGILRMPARPEEVYANEWQGWRHFLGTDFVTYREAQRLVRELGIDTIEGYNALPPKERTELRLPANPFDAYRGEWTSWPEFFGRPARERRPGAYSSFREARKILARLGIERRKDYELLSNSVRKKHGLPEHPETVYSALWQGWKHFLTPPVVVRLADPVSFSEAQTIARREGIVSRRDYLSRGTEWRVKHRLPARPEVHYADEWPGWPVFTGRAES